MHSGSLDLRLTALFSLFFLISTVVVFATTYILLATSIGQEERSALESRVVEVIALYETGGLALVREELSREEELGGEWQFVIRIAGKRSETLYFLAPDRLSGMRPSVFATNAVPGTFRRVTLQDGSSTFLVTGRRLHDGHTLQVAVATAVRDRILTRFRRVLFLVSATTIVVAFGGGFFFASRALRPIRRLIQTTRGIIETGSLSARIPGKQQSDELGQLVELFNRMLERIETIVQGMRDALDNVAHDLRTPLTRIRTGAEVALQERKDPSRWERGLVEVVEQSGGLLRMIRTLMDISEAETGTMRLEKERCDLSQVVEDLAELYRYAAEEKGLEFRLSLPPELPCAADTERIRQVLANLLDNAVKYTPRGGVIEVRGALEAGWIVLDVSDTGIGIAPDEISHVWDRLFRGRRGRYEAGLGLGLNLVKAVVGAHGGTVTVESVLGRGSRFAVRLPQSLPS
jgi:signal transduction histidine kinase